MSFQGRIRNPQSRMRAENSWKSWKSHQNAISKWNAEMQNELKGNACRRFEREKKPRHTAFTSSLKCITWQTVCVCDAVAQYLQQKKSRKLKLQSSDVDTHRKHVYNTTIVFGLFAVYQECWIVFCQLSSFCRIRCGSWTKNCMKNEFESEFFRYACTYICKSQFFFTLQRRNVLNFFLNLFFFFVR